MTRLNIFLLLIERVSGIGPATAIAILGSLSVEQFKQAVVGGDVSGIARAKGVGKKTAERIVLELKDKVGLAATWEAQAQGATPTPPGDYDWLVQTPAVPSQDHCADLRARWQTGAPAAPQTQKP